MFLSQQLCILEVFWLQTVHRSSKGNTFSLWAGCLAVKCMLTRELFISVLDRANFLMKGIPETEILSLCLMRSLTFPLLDQCFCGFCFHVKRLLLLERSKFIPVPSKNEPETSLRMASCSNWSQSRRLVSKGAGSTTG